MKIYGSIPEPQRQKIRGYWMQCGEREEFNSRDLLAQCNAEYFDQIGVQKAEKKLLSMRQGESQIFREFLEEWELTPTQEQVTMGKRIISYTQTYSLLEDDGPFTILDHTKSVNSTVCTNPWSPVISKL